MVTIITLVAVYFAVLLAMDKDRFNAERAFWALLAIVNSINLAKLVGS